MTRERAVVLLCIVASCSGASVTPSAGRVPMNHRASPSACSPRVGTAQLCPSSQASSVCATDRDCLEGGVNGRCVPGIRDTGGASDAACACIYDRCANDADCRGHGPCQCAALEVGNACRAGNCASDADCGVGRYCSPVTDPCTGLASAYWCHTSRDTCVDDTDCSTTCAYVESDESWECAVGGVLGCPATAPPPTAFP